MKLTGFSQGVKYFLIDSLSFGYNTLVIEYFFLYYDHRKKLIANIYSTKPELILKYSMHELKKMGICGHEFQVRFNAMRIQG